MSNLLNLLRGADPLSVYAMEGKVFYASDADQNDRVTGQTSFAATTPTFILDVPSGYTAIPLYMSLTQNGTVAGDTINVIMEIDNADRYGSSGTEETVLSARTGLSRTNNCKLYSGATANAGYGIRVDSWVLGQDVAPAEGAPNKVLWTPAGTLDFVNGPGAWLVFTFAGTTGPTWDWTFKWMEVLTSDLRPGG